MAQENPYAKYREQSQPVPIAQIKPIIAAPVDPNKDEQEKRAQTSTELSIADELRAGRKEKFDYAKSLRDEFRKAPETTNYETVIRQFSSALGAQPTPTGDQALITAYAKMLDPGSVVRTEEFNTVQAGDSKLGSIVARLQKELGVDDSGLIRPEVRARVLQEMRNLTENYRAGYDRARADYEGLAGSYGIEPNLVLGTRIDTPYQDKIATLLKERGVGENQGQPQSQQLAITGGERFSTDQDKAIAAAVQQAWASGADVQGLAAAAEAAGGTVTPADIEAFQQAVEARAQRQPVTFTPAKSGQRSALQQAAGEFLMTPAGTALTGAVNAAGAGLLSQVAGDQIQGLEALNPAAGLTGEIVGSALGTAGLAKGAAAGLKAVAPSMASRFAGGGAAGAIGRELATDVAYGGIYGANTGEGFLPGAALGAVGSLGGQALGAGIRRAAPAVGRLLGREVPPPDGGVPPMGGGPAVPPGGGVPPAGGAMGGAAEAGVPPMGGGAMGGAEEPFIPSTVRSRDAGAAGVSDETLRRMQAEGLPVPVELTRGAATRDAEQLAFEKEQLYGALGGPLRKRAEENNLQALENFDRLLDQTGAQAPDIAATGNAVINALSKGYQAAKNKVNVAYKRADMAGETQELVDYKPILDYIAEQPATTVDQIAPILKTVAEQLRKNDPDGTGQITIRNLEEVRKLINKNVQQGTPNANYGGQLKGLIDDATEGAGGELYQTARKLRIEQARKFENRAIVARLVTNVKNMDDPKVAADKVFQRSVMNASPEEIQFLRRTLRTSGAEGRQAWKELQGATIRHIQDVATSGVNLTSENLPVISTAKLNQEISKLDKNGRLDVIFEPKMAQTLRDLRDVVQYVNTVPPGTSINNSGTARTLIAALGEMSLTGATTGLPLPVISGLKLLRDGVRDAKIKAKIAKSLIPPETN